MNDTLDAPIVWSPDGERAAAQPTASRGLSYQGDQRWISPRAKSRMKSKNGEVVMGWVPYTGN